MARRAARREALRQPHVMPLEPRIMMDATLDMGVGTFFTGYITAHETNAVSDIIKLAGDIYQQFDDMGDALGDALTNVLQGTGASTNDSLLDLFANEEQNQYLDGNGSPIDDVFADLGELGYELADSVLNGIKDDISDVLSSVRTQLKADYTDDIQTKINALKTIDDAITGSGPGATDKLTATEISDIVNSFGQSIDQLGLRELLDPTDAFAKILDGIIGAARTGMGDRLDDTSNSSKEAVFTQIGAFAPTFGDAFVSTAVSKIVALGSNDPAFNTQITLNDVIVGGKTLVAFSQLDPGNTDTNDSDDVDVKVALGELIPNLAGIFERLGVDGETLASLSAINTAFIDGLTFDFNIKVTSADDTSHTAYVTSEDTDNDPDTANVNVNHAHKNISLAASGFAIRDSAGVDVVGSGVNFGFGGDIVSATDGLGVSLGLFSAGITEISLAKFNVELGGLDFTAVHKTFDQSFAVTGTAPTVTVTIDDVGGGTSAVAFNLATVYNFASIEFETAFDWGLDPDDLPNAVTGFVATGAFSLSGALAPASPANALKVSFAVDAKAVDGNGDEVTLTGAELDVLDNLQETIEGLLQVDGLAFLDRLTDLSSSLDVLFSSDVFDVSLPFFDDFHLSDVINAFEKISDTLLEPFQADLGIIGLTAGTDHSVGGSLLLDDIDLNALNTTTDPLKFDIEVTRRDDRSKAPDAGNISVDTYTVTLVRPAGGFQSLGDLANAIVAAMKLVTADVPDPDLTHTGWVTGTLNSIVGAVAVRGVLELRGVGIEGFRIKPVTGSEDMLSGMGIVPPNNTVNFDDNDIAGTAIDDLISDGWRSLFELNLNLSRTVTYADGTVETVQYRTLTLSPQGGAWTLDGLKTQLNSILASAGVTVTVGTANDGLTFTLNEANAATAYAKAGTTVQDVAFTFSIDGAKASIASSVEALEAFVNDELAGLGASLDIDLAAGELNLIIDHFDVSYEATYDNATLSLGVGDAASLELAADLAMQAAIEFGFDVGINLRGLLASGEDESLGEFVYLDNVAFHAELEGSASSITGTGKLGIIEVELGGTDPTENNLGVGADFDISLIGRDDDGQYSSRVTFDQLLTEANSLSGILGMIGQLDLTGNQTDDYFAYLDIGDIEITIAGMEGLLGLTSNAITGFTVGLADISKPTDWVLTYEGGLAGVGNTIAGLRSGDFIDTLYNALIVVNEMLAGLTSDFEVLGMDIPVLGISVMDALNFAEEMAGKLQAFKNDPNGTLSELSASLASAFGLGEDDLQLVWDTETQTFYVALSLAFLEGEEFSYDFSLDLAELLAGATDPDGTIGQLLNVVTSVVNVTGDGRIVLDAEVGFNVTFGIDLSRVFGGADTPVTAATLLTALGGVSQITFNSAKSGQDGKDLIVSIARETAGNSTPEYIDLKVELDDAKTVGDAVEKIWQEIASEELDEDIGFVLHGKVGTTDTDITIDATNFDDADFGVTGFKLTSIEFIDLAAQLASFTTDYEPLEGLFGDDIDADIDAAGDPPTITGTADLNDAGFDPSDAQQFMLRINGADPILVDVTARIDDSATTGVDESIRDLAGLIDDINLALKAAEVARSDVGLGFFGNLELSQLIVASVDGDGQLVLTATNFAETIGADQISFTLTGMPTGSTSHISVGDIGGSNLATALGFPVDAEDQPRGGEGRVDGEALAAVDADSGVSAFFVTEDTVIDLGASGADASDVEVRATGISLQFKAGVEEGLNMALSFGPLQVSVVDGVAMIDDGANGFAHIDFGLDGDADGSADDGRLYLDVIGDVIDGEVALSDLFALNADVVLRIVLPLKDSLGFLDPEEHHIEISGVLLAADGNGIDVTGALWNILNHQSPGLTIEVVLPSFDDIMESLNPLAILNDPLLLANGLDMIFAAIDKTLRAVINAMDVPVVGDSLTRGLGVFNDIRSSLIQPLLEIASTPDAEGNLPTTMDLLTGVVNDVLEDLFGIEDIVKATAITDLDNPMILAEISFNETIFEAALDVAFNLGIDGFGLEVGEASALLFKVIADIHIGFGLDKKGFFFLNDEDDPEISLTAYVSLPEEFEANAKLGLVGIRLSAEGHEIEDENGDPIEVDGESFFGALLEGHINIDLFTTLGTEVLDGSDLETALTELSSNHDWDRTVHLSELSTGKSATGEGSKIVSIEGGFSVHINLGMVTSVINPVTGDEILDLPSGVADLVMDGHYTIGEKLVLERLEFQNLGLNAGQFLNENLLPVVEQIRDFVEPVADALSFMTTPIFAGSSILDIVKEALKATGLKTPAIQAALFIFQAVETLEDVIDFIDGYAEDGIIDFGTFSLLSTTAANGIVNLKDSKAVGSLRPTVTGSASAGLTGALSNGEPGIKFDLRIFDDVSNVLNLITGNLADVDLFAVDLTLLDFSLNINLAANIKAALAGIPGEVIDLLTGGLNANLFIGAQAGLTVGYDLYGIAEFLNSSDPVDILDGIYFDSDRPLLALEASFGARVGLNLGIISAGFEFGGYFAVSMDLNDPNDDGKLRIGEIVQAVDGNAANILRLIEGDIRGGIYLSVYFEIDFFFFSIGDSFTVFSFDFTAHFGYEFPMNYVDVVGDADVLNIGAKAGSLAGGDGIDGDDQVYFVGRDIYLGLPGSGSKVGTLSNDALIIYAGDGDNVIDLTGLDATIFVQVYTGSGNDKIAVRGDQSGVIVSGEGDDRIFSSSAELMMSFAAFGAAYPGLTPLPGPASATPPAGTAGSAYSQIDDKIPGRSNLSQTMLVLTGAGSDNIDLSNRTEGAVVIGGDVEISEGTSRVKLSDWLQTKFGNSAPDMSLVLDKVAAEMPRYTAEWQTKGDTAADTIIGTDYADLILAENGDDVIDGRDGDDIIFAGGGNDSINAGSGDDYVEAGAGADVVIGGDGDDVLLGWGRYDETTTEADYTAATGLTSTALADFIKLSNGAQVDDEGDWIQGDGGDDTIHGGGGNDILQGGDDDDLMFGGSGSDIMAGGAATVTPAGGSAIAVVNGQLNASIDLSGVYTVSTSLGDDGDDHLMGQAGHDVMVGGGGDDRLEGQGGNNILIGDFADLKMSGDTTLLEANATAIDSAFQGDDTLIGGALVDIIMGNGGKDTLSGDMGKNILIGDNALLSSTNLYTGITGMRSLLGDKDDADKIYTGLTTSLIVAGLGDTANNVGDEIYTGLAYDSGLSDNDLLTAAQRMIIFADYGDLEGPVGDLGTLTTVFSVGDDDKVSTSGGNDIIFAGVGDDEVSSGLGHDIVFGDTGTYEGIFIGRRGFTLSSDHAAIAYDPVTDTSDVRYRGGQQTGTSATIIGDDKIHGGDGNNLIIAGGGADEVTTGTGLDVILGDLGDIEVFGRYASNDTEDLDAPTVTATSSEPVTGDDTWGDEIVAGLGDDIVIGASGSDIIGGGATGENDLGRLNALGDFGSISVRLLDAQKDRVFHDIITGEDDGHEQGDLQDPDDQYGPMKTFEVVSLTSSNAGQGAADEIYGGASVDVLIGGSGKDLIYGYADDDVLFGDHASFVYNTTAQGYAAGGYETGYGDDDEIHGGDGNDAIVGGFGSDTMYGEADNDLIVGDWAILTFGTARSLTTQATEHGAAETIHGGEGDDIIIGGRGADDLWGDEGANVIFGDYSDLTWASPTGNAFAIKTAALSGLDVTADDTIHTNGATEAVTDESSIAVGGRGADTIYGGMASDLILADWGTFLFQDPDLYPTRTAFERIITVESTEPSIKDNDTAYGFHGRDIMIMGDGDDYADGGEDQDLIAGDHAAFTNHHNGYQLFESRFPFEGGDDVLKGGPGNDMIISGYFNFGEPRPIGDLIYGDTIEDFLMAGAGSLYIHGFMVERFNYLGLDPADNISNQQLSASAGVQLRPHYDRAGGDLWFSPFLLTVEETEDFIDFAGDEMGEEPSAAMLQTLDALVTGRILTPDVLRLIQLYRSGAIELDDLDAELREALVAALFDTYGYRLPEPVANMLDRYLELLYEKLDIDTDADESADAETTPANAPADFADRFAAAFDRA